MYRSSHHSAGANRLFAVELGFTTIHKQPQMMQVNGFAKTSWMTGSARQRNVSRSSHNMEPVAKAPESSEREGGVGETRRMGRKTSSCQTRVSCSLGFERRT